MPFDSGLGVRWENNAKVFEYDQEVFGPEPEYRRLNSIRVSLRDPECEGPDPVYSIAMDIGRREHRAELHRRMLLFGVVAYSAGRLGQEPVRSQGHIHAVSQHSGWSAPELFEIWQGRAIVYAQQYAADDPGDCFAVEAGPGDQVVVPPSWAHCVINADPDAPMVFAACCDRQYGFVYDEVRARCGLAWFPVLDRNNEISWEPNPRYKASSLVRRQARSYEELGISGTIPIYEQFVGNPDSVQWVSAPAYFADLWGSFKP